MNRSTARQLQAAVTLKKRAAAAEREAVLAARMDGWTWQQIAAQLGISHQATRQKYGELAGTYVRTPQPTEDDAAVVQQAQVILLADAHGMAVSSGDSEVLP